MDNTQDSFMTVEAALQSPLISTNLVSFNFAAPIDDVLLDASSHWLDLCLTPRMQNARACFRDRWHPQHFEPLGQVYMVPAGQALHARADRGGHRAIICLLRSEQARECFEGRVEWTDQSLRATLNIRSENVRNLLLRLGEEALHPGFASDAMAEAISQQLLIELARYYCVPAGAGPIGRLSAWRLRLIDERLEEVPHGPSLSELAQLCHLSVRQLTRAFRESRGCSIGSYIARMRVEKAKRMLAGDDSIKAIAYTLGFGSPSAFCYAFRVATTETPSAYRKRGQRGLQHTDDA